MGSSSSRDEMDNRGRKKVRCRICKRFHHDLTNHLRKKHDMSPEEYRESYPGAAVLSEWGRERAARQADRDEGKEPFIFGPAHAQVRLYERSNDAADQTYVPDHDEGWEPGPEEDEAMEAFALAIDAGENIMIVGPPGTGKSTLVRQMAFVTNTPVRRVPFRGDMRVSDLVGSPSLQVDDATGKVVTGYRAAALPMAYERGFWFHADEIDSGPDEMMFALHPVLEEKPHLVLTGRGDGYEVPYDDRFRFIATANTLGWGDDTGLFAGTRPMNEALLDRFGTVIRLDYPSADAEIERIVKRCGIEKDDAAKIVDVAGKIREAQRRGQVVAGLSPRRVITWANKTVKMKSARRAAKLTITNRLSQQDATVVDGIVKRVFGS